MCHCCGQSLSLYSELPKDLHVHNPELNSIVVLMALFVPYCILGELQKLRGLYLSEIVLIFVSYSSLNWHLVYSTCELLVQDQHSICKTLVFFNPDTLVVLTVWGCVCIEMLLGKGYNTKKMRIRYALLCPAGTFCALKHIYTCSVIFRC